MRKAALAAHRAPDARAAHAVAGPHGLTGARSMAVLAHHAAAARRCAHYSSGPVAVSTLLYASGFQVKAQKYCALREL